MLHDDSMYHRRERSIFLDGDILQALLFPFGHEGDDPPSIDLTEIGFSMWIFLDQLVMQAQNIVEWHPGPKQLRHNSMFLFGIFVDIEEGFARQPTMRSDHVPLVLTHPKTPEGHTLFTRGRSLLGLELRTSATVGRRTY